MECADGARQHTIHIIFFIFRVSRALLKTGGGRPINHFSRILAIWHNFGRYLRIGSTGLLCCVMRAGWEEVKNKTIFDLFSTSSVNLIFGGAFRLWWFIYGVWFSSNNIKLSPRCIHTVIWAIRCRLSAALHVCALDMYFCFEILCLDRSVSCHLMNLPDNLIDDLVATLRALVILTKWWFTICRQIEFTP